MWKLMKQQICLAIKTRKTIDDQRVVAILTNPTSHAHFCAEFCWILSHFLAFCGTLRSHKCDNKQPKIRFFPTTLISSRNQDLMLSYPSVSREKPSFSLEMGASTGDCTLRGRLFRLPSNNSSPTSFFTWINGIR